MRHVEDLFKARPVEITVEPTRRGRALARPRQTPDAYRVSDVRWGLAVPFPELDPAFRRALNRDVLVPILQTGVVR